ncbi:hypothetical protein H9X90_07040 [Faecalicatena contorta]|uniref:alpha/beta hydrolase domain-containing protein n=1 Tax=Faecalicatena contorta TaxID=39482 RepID=UPI00195FD5F4|nr:alpha/beta hydrolase domain-containing protein [Faecalicatena contorta]MBM6684958.1 hypothetical protein [Faecalicatena contorta]MBM6710486.1 hypothetical protein [Faecalicatena contorta]
MTVEEKVLEQAYKVPEVEGPIPVTEESHPFCAMKYSRVPLDVSKYGFVEEEYFLSSTANVYDCDVQDNLIIKTAELAYKNRILVRYPQSKENFSGRVYVDILNATQRYDIEDLWHRNYQWCMKCGHAYVGITSKPVNVQSLKNFDYSRYWSLDWTGSERVPFPTVSNSAVIPGTEEGLIWDMLSQLCFILKYGTSVNVLGGLKAEYVYLCGQSQSGAYLNTFVSYFDRILSKGNYKLYDGYMNIVGALVQRSLRQQEHIGMLNLELRHMKPSSTPYICISSEADLSLFNMFLDQGNLLDVTIENSDTPENKCRYYEFPGTPHTDILCPVLTSLDEIEKTGAPLPNLDKQFTENINDYPLEYYICGMLDKLHGWVSEKEAPQVRETMMRESGHLVFDENGNAKGGFRTPLVDLPIATYMACNPDNPEGISGKIEYFSRERAEELYGTQENYLEMFNKQLDQQVKEGWLPEMFEEDMKKWAKTKAEKIFQQ